MTDDNTKKQLKRNAVQFEQVVNVDGNPTGEVIANVPIPHESKKLREMRKKAEKRKQYMANRYRSEEE
jgi:hypothetical protein